MRMMKMGAIAVVLLLAGSVALAQESEFQDKLQEDLDSYKAQIIDACGTNAKLTIKWNGKLGGNPREIEAGAYSNVSTLCTSALEGLHSACQENKVVKKAVSKVSAIVCQKGSGTIGYSLKGAALTFTIDPKFDKNNAAGQRDDLVSKLKKDLDK